MSLQYAQHVKLKEKDDARAQNYKIKSHIFNMDLKSDGCIMINMLGVFSFISWQI